MIALTINGIPVMVEPGTTLLEAARYLGIEIPTLCHMEGLTPYGACRLCMVEIGVAPAGKLVSACTYPAQEGLKVRTGSSRVMRARRMILELLLASCPQSKIIQDLACRLRSADPALSPGARGLYPVRAVCAHVRGADDGEGYRLPWARGASHHRYALRCSVGSLPPVRRLPVRVSGLPTALHVQRAGEGDLRRLRQYERAVPGEAEVR